MKKIIFNAFFVLSLLTVFGCKSTDGIKSPVKPSGMTQIHIVSTENGGNMNFVTTPVSNVVTEAKKGWLEPNHPELKLPEPWYEKCVISVYDKDGIKLLDDASGQVKVRGNWSSSYAKKPLRIKFDEKQAMSNMHNGTEFKNWVLLAEVKDFSLLRNAIALKTAKIIDKNYYASDYEFAEVYINGKFWGVYLLAEQQESKKGKIKLTEDTNSNEIGYFIEYDGNASFEDFNFDIQYNYNNNALIDFYGNKIVKNSSSYSFKSDVTQEQTNFISAYMNNLWKLCYEAAYNNNFYKFDGNYNLVKAASGEFKDAKACISEVVDLDSLVAAYLHQEIVCDADIYLNSFFMDLDLSSKNKKKLTFEAPWDFDSSMGNKRQCADGQGVWAGAICPNVNFDRFDECNPWLLVFINCDWFREMIKTKWIEISNSHALDQLIAQIDDFTNIYSENFAKNSKRWYIPVEIFGDELNSISSKCKNQKEAAGWLKEWLTKRFAYLEETWGNIN